MFRRFCSHWLAVVGSIIILIMAFCAVAASVVAPYEPNKINLLRISHAPDLQNLLGTDAVDRDEVSRIIYVARVSLSVGVVAVSLYLTIGFVLGSLAGYAGGWVDNLIMRFTDVMMCFPTFVLILILVGILGPNIFNVMLVIGLFGWPGIASLVREALNSLVALGIVEKRHGSGIYVREFDAERLAEQLSYGLREDAAYWRHLYEARVELETMIAPLAAQRISVVQLARLQSLIEAMRRQTERGEGVEDNDYAFHRLLAASSANPVLDRLAGALLAGDPRTIRNHEPLLVALEARDPDASVEAMRYHFRMTPGLMETTTDRRATS